MGMPTVSISFTETAATAIKRGDRGIIAMILKDKVYKNQAVDILTETDIPKTMAVENKEQIRFAMIGYQNVPKKVIAYILDADAEEPDYTEALVYFETHKFNYLAAPTAQTDGMCSTIVTWIKKQRGNGKKVKAVLPNTAADSEGIINYTTQSVSTENKTYSTEQYCARIAGLIAGTPLRISCTYASLPELTDCTKLAPAEMDNAVDNGEFIVWWDGEKVKTARAVTSLTTTTAERGAKFKKIKIVDTIDMIYEDIKKVTEDSYLGKYENSYDNKGLLISAIMGYFTGLVQDKVLASYTVDIDVEANRAYLMSKGGKVTIDGGEEKKLEDCTDEDIRKADTDDHVFLKASVRIYDAIEDIALPIAI